jgi:hypothetical protein
LLSASADAFYVLLHLIHFVQTLRYIKQAGQEEGFVIHSPLALVPHNSIAQLVDNSSNQHLHQQQQLQLQRSAAQPAWQEAVEQGQGVAHVQQHEVDHSDVQLHEESHDEDENFF